MALSDTKSLVCHLIQIQGSCLMSPTSRKIFGTFSTKRCGNFGAERGDSDADPKVRQRGNNTTERDFLTTTDRHQLQVKKPISQHTIPQSVHKVAREKVSVGTFPIARQLLADGALINMLSKAQQLPTIEV